MGGFPVTISGGGFGVLGGKDSIVMFHLARKAFRFGNRPIQLPFPLLHIDTGHNYPEVIAFRDEIVAQTGVQLIVEYVEDSIARGSVKLRKATDSRNAAQATTLLEAIEKHEFDALMGGARRDEEKARAKEPGVGGGFYKTVKSAVYTLNKNKYESAREKNTK